MESQAGLLDPVATALGSDAMRVVRYLKCLGH